MTLGAIVICGGQSRRMGQSKASLAFGPESMLERVVRLVGEAAGPIVVVAAPGQALPDFGKNVQIVRDTVEGRGPLQALHDGLIAIDDRVDFVYATATDAPFLVPAWVELLASVIGADDAAIPVIGGFSHPLAAVYRRSTVLPAIRSLLDREVFRLRSLIPLIRAREVGADELCVVDPDLSTLINLNTPDDYRDALERAAF